MKINLKHKLQVTILLFVTAFINFVTAAEVPALPPPTGAGGPGTVAATPIDMYQIVLFFLAVSLIVFFFRKIKLSKV